MQNVSLSDLSLEEMINYIKSGKRNIQQVLDEYPLGYISHRKDGDYMKVHFGSNGWIKLEGSENDYLDYPKGTYFTVKQDTLVLVDGTYEEGWLLKKEEEVTDIQHFAKGNSIYSVNSLRKKFEKMYGIKTKVEDWTKSKGLGLITNGTECRFTELHWYDVKNFGKFEIKEKLEDM